MESIKFFRLGTPGSILVRLGPGQQALAFHTHECMGYGGGQGVYTVLTLYHAGVLYLKSVFGFLEGPSSLFSFIFSRCPSLLDAWASSMLIYLAARAMRASNLVAGFLAKDLKKSPSNNPCTKALALTSWVAVGTSRAPALKHWSYSFRGSPSFWRMEKMLNSVFGCFNLLANWCRNRERNSWKLPITGGGNWLNHCCPARAKVLTKTQHFMSLGYRCSMAAFSKRDRCSCGSVVSSYSVVAGVLQFIGSSSSITPSVKGMLVCSSAIAPIIWY
ncbi:UNVERIFIED_CONTAM: hypothetical protein Sradi_5835200 [Sesamum radiatum]|uniref:Uncharacterized protein n=1 Tax=Sesamum radiatum TaxID=300843 RepID=A0AAW2KQE5_SESRA